MPRDGTGWFQSSQVAVKLGPHPLWLDQHRQIRRRKERLRRRVLHIWKKNSHDSLRRPIGQIPTPPQRLVAPTRLAHLKPICQPCSQTIVHHRREITLAQAALGSSPVRGLRPFEYLNHETQHTIFFFLIRLRITFHLPRP